MGTVTLPSENERRFLINASHVPASLHSYTSYDIVQSYLKRPDEETTYCFEREGQGDGLFLSAWCQERGLRNIYIPPDKVGTLPRLFDAGYISEPGFLSLPPTGIMRVRSKQKADGVQIGELTIKAFIDGKMLEFEGEISMAALSDIVLLAGDKTLLKHRTEIPHRGYLIELDQYQGDHAGLIVAEVEQESDAALASLILPDWFGPEITGVEAFSNAALAQRGVPWERLSRLLPSAAPAPRP